MPQKPRLEVPGAVYHVMSQCLQHYSLFSDDEDRERFLSLLGLYLAQSNALCYAWALMGAGSRSFQEIAGVLKRFGSAQHESRTNLRNFMREGLSCPPEDDMLVGLVRKSNEGFQEGRSTQCRVIGDRDFVTKALDSTAAARLRISRFEKEGASLETIARPVCDRFGVSIEEMASRQCDFTGPNGHRIHRGPRISCSTPVDSRLPQGGDHGNCSHVEKRKNCREQEVYG